MSIFFFFLVAHTSSDVINAVWLWKKKGESVTCVCVFASASRKTPFPQTINGDRLCAKSGCSILFSFAFFVVVVGKWTYFETKDE